MTTQTACTGSPPDRPESVRRGGVEDDRRTGAELVLVEPHADAQPSARDVAVLTAAVGDERVVRAGLCADRIHDLEKLDFGIAARREALPAHSRGEVDHASRVGVRDQTVVVIGMCSGGLGGAGCAPSPNTSLIVIPSSETSA